MKFSRFMLSRINGTFQVYHLFTELSITFFKLFTKACVTASASRDSFNRLPNISLSVNTLFSLLFIFYLFLKFTMARVGHSFSQSPQFRHLSNKMLAKWFSTSMASNLQTFLHFPQPMQATLQILRAFPPGSVELHPTYTNFFLSDMVITWLGQTWTHIPQPTQASRSTTATPLQT